MVVIFCNSLYICNIFNMQDLFGFLHTDAQTDIPNHALFRRRCTWVKYADQEQTPYGTDKHGWAYKHQNGKQKTAAQAASEDWQMTHTHANTVLVYLAIFQSYSKLCQSPKQTSGNCYGRTFTDSAFYIYSVTNGVKALKFDSTTVTGQHVAMISIKIRSLSTACGPCLCNISWIQANWFKQYHTHRYQRTTQKTCGLDLWPWY